MPTVKQGLEQKLQQKLSPLQIQTIKLIEMPVQALEQHVREVMNDNPVIDDTPERGESDEPRDMSISEVEDREHSGGSLEDNYKSYSDDDDPTPYYNRSVNNWGKDERPEYNTFSVKESFTQSLMELGATVCLPNGAPLCGRCPLRGLCLAHLAGEELLYPFIPPKKPRRIDEKTVLLLFCRGRYAIRKREEKGLLSGLWEFPNAVGTLSPEEIKKLLQPEELLSCGSSRHVFTHVEWLMTGYRLVLKEEIPGYIWRTPEEIRRDYSLPTAFRFYQNQLD